MPDSFEDVVDETARQRLALDPRKNEQVRPKELARCRPIELVAPRDLRMWNGGIRYAANYRSSPKCYHAQRDERLTLGLVLLPPHPHFVERRCGVARVLTVLRARCKRQV